MVTAPSISLKVIFMVHLVLTTWAGMNLGAAYIYMNAFMLVFGMWSIISQENSEAILMFFITNVAGIVMDIIFLGIAGNAMLHPGTGLSRFCAAIAIINLLLRPVSSFILFRLYQDRTGEYGDFGIPGMPGMPNFSHGGSPRSGGYENIDQPVPSNSVETASPHSTIDKSPLP